LTQVGALPACQRQVAPTDLRERQDQGGGPTVVDLARHRLRHGPLPNSQRPTRRATGSRDSGRASCRVGRSEAWEDSYARIKVLTSPFDIDRIGLISWLFSNALPDP